MNKRVFVPYEIEGNQYLEQLYSGSLQSSMNLRSDPGINFLGSYLSQKFDVIHFHWLGFLLGPHLFNVMLRAIYFLVQIVVLRLAGVRIIWTIHNLQNHEKRHVWLERTCAEGLLLLSSEVIVHCDRARTRVDEWFVFSDSESRVISHGHFIDYYPRGATRTESRNELNLDDEELVITCFGEIRPYKQFIPLINAFQELNASGSRLVIVGHPKDQELTERIRQLSREDERITLVTRYVASEKIQYYLNASNLMICPYEEVLTSGGVILAMSFAKPCVAPEMGCVSGLIEDGKGGFTYERTDSEEIKQTLGRAIDNQTKLESMGDYNFRKAQKTLDWASIREQTLSIYR